MRHWFVLLVLLCFAAPADAQFRPPAPFSNLGPLAPMIGTGGPAGDWTATDEKGRLLLANPGAKGSIRYYYTDWQGDLAAGRSVSVRVQTEGQGEFSSAGLVFRVQPQGDPRWLAFVVTAKGQVALYSRRPDGFKVVSSVPIPGGHHAEGDVLTLNQRGSTAQLIVNGYLVTELTSINGQDPNDPAPVGIIGVDTGTFDVLSFSFGRFVNAAPAPAAPPEALEVATLGPLGHDISVGARDGWTVAIENRQLIYSRSDDDLAYIYRHIGWPGGVAQGRSATLTVVAAAAGQDAGAGLAFGVSADGKHLYGLTLAADGKVKLLALANNELSIVDSFDPPQKQQGGGRHVLKISQDGAQTVFYADGARLGAMTGQAARDAEGEVGLIVLGKGRFAFQDFAFGPGDAPAPPAADTPQPRKPLHSFSPETFGALFGIIAHEFGHFMIGELKIPATGPEEDVADEFAAMVFIDNLKDAPDLTRQMALGNAKLWWFLAQDRGDNSTPFYDEHAPDRARFAKFSCMLYGAAPEVFNGLMDEAGIPPRSKQRCLQDEPKRHAAWDKLLTPLRRRGVSPNIPGDLDPSTPGHKVSVVYFEPKDPAMRPFAEEIRDSGVFEVIAEAVTKQFVLPRDTKIVFRDCGVENCFYSPGDGSVTMCWEMITFVMQEFRKHGQASPAPPNEAAATSLDQLLLGRWRERSSVNGMVVDMELEFAPQNAYRARMRVLSPQAMTIEVEGQWRIVAAGGNRAQLSFAPLRWSPQQAPMTRTTVPIELLDRNSFRSQEGTATRVQ